MSAPFWINDEHDRLAASDRVSRYGVYVRQRIPGGFAECWDGTFETRLTEHFAAEAWRTATTPVMAPPYADWRSPVLSAKVELDADGDSDGLIATVEIAASQPLALRDCRSRAGDHSWRSWPRDRSWGGEEYFRGPYGDEVARGTYYALTTMRLVFPVPVRVLAAAPGAGHRRGEVEETARLEVAALVAEFNRAAWPVLNVLEGS